MKVCEYDVIVIGGGAAGLTASGMAANFGAKTLMIEAEKLGGDCTWTGCVPSKTLLKAGKVAQQMREAGKYGLLDTEPEIDFQKVMLHVHSIRDDIYEDADAPENFEKMGVEVCRGHASFVDDHTLIVEQEKTVKKVNARYIFICAGASPAAPAIPGLDSMEYLTTESLFEIKELPEKLIIIGAGNVGVEMAQAMNRLGAEVTVIDQERQILQNDDPELSNMLKAHLHKEGIKFVLNANIQKVEQHGDETNVHISVEGKDRMLAGSSVLVAAGRQPNVNSLNLEAAGIEYFEKGIEVNQRCRTNISHIYACGDITGRYFFTHMSDHMAKVAVSNALLKLPLKVDDGHVPWCTYTDPELAQVGATEKQLIENGVSYKVYQFPYSKLDRALLESETRGMIKVFAKKWTGKILGASILGARAGELISEYAVAMKGGTSLGRLSGIIHPYPSYGLGARRAADQWFLRIRPTWLLKLLKGLFGYKGKVPVMNSKDDII